MTTSTAHASPLRVALASFIGTTVEFYDFLIYGTAAALVFPKLFLCRRVTSGGIAVVVRHFWCRVHRPPLGGMVFGHYGDRIGRKRMLAYSLLLMGAATVLMGLLSTYAQIGLNAPILLTLLRLAQGFAVGGEWGGATLMAVEHAPAPQKGMAHTVSGQRRADRHRAGDSPVVVREPRLRRTA